MEKRNIPPGYKEKKNAVVMYSCALSDFIRLICQGVL